jgi:hypothetical protein
VANKTKGEIMKKEKAAEVVKKVSKKSIILSILNGKGGTLDQMSAAIIKAGLGGSPQLNRRVSQLWLPKLNIKIKRDEKTGIYRKA